MGVALLDFSTGEFSAAEYAGDEGLQALADELALLRPREIVAAQSDDGSAALPPPIAASGVPITAIESWAFDYETARRAFLYFQFSRRDGSPAVEVYVVPYRGFDSADRASGRPRCRSLMGFRVVGTGSYVPDAVVTNDHLFERFGFDSDWIVKRTGIYERRHALPHQATSDLALEAVRRCLDSAKVHPRNIDLCLVGTFPVTARNGTESR